MEEEQWSGKASSSQNREVESFGEKLETDIQMAECIYVLDGPDDLPKNPELVELLCAEPDKPALEVQDPLETIDLRTKEDPRPIQISGLLETEDRARIVNFLHEFKYCFAWHYTEMPGFLVHQRGVEVDKNKARAIMETPPPTNKVQLQKLLGKINFLRRLIANLAGKIQPLTPLLRLKDKEKFEWGPPYQKAFDSIKAYLAYPPVLMPPQRGKSLKLYISALDRSIGSLLAQNNEGGKGQAIYYLSRILTENTARAGIVIIDPKGYHHCYSFLFDYQKITNNRAEYEALIIGLEILIELGAIEVEVFGDSKLVINQLNGEYKCRRITMADYYLVTTQLLRYWGDEISVSYISRGSNTIANEMAQLVTEVHIQERRFKIELEVQKKNLPSIFDR
ncbi:unnamed protein product [Malus baccata var. baccata]